MKFRDVEQLSAYLDGHLSPDEAARIEGRLVVDARLRQVLDDLRVARGLARRIPHRKAPRSFALSAVNPRVLAPRPRAVPILRYAGGLAALLFVFSAAFNTLAPLAGRSMAAAPTSGYGLGGGVGGGAPDAEAPLESLAAPAAPQESQLDLSAPTEEPFAKAAPEGGAGDAQPTAAPAPIPANWMLIFAILGIGLASLAWYVDRHTRRDFRSKFLEK